jgi:GH15 family glucan-1,4-alpha-glucosidase
MIRRLHALSGRIHEEVCRRGYDASRGHFVDCYGSKKLDASLLLLPLVNFLPVNDPRMAATIAAIERELMDGGLVRRKPANNDGHDEGAFLVCSCWLADCMAKQGRHDEARTILERVIGLSNEVLLRRRRWARSSGFACLDANRYRGPRRFGALHCGRRAALRICAVLW